MHAGKNEQLKTHKVTEETVKKLLKERERVKEKKRKRVKD